MQIRRKFPPAIALLALATLGFSTPAAAQTTGLVEFFSSGKLQQGLALVDSAHEMLVIGRDGGLHALDRRDRDLKIRPIEGRYQPASATEVRNDLRAEFGRDFEVVATRNFLVVQPKGRGDRWPKMFERSHRAFVSYMSRRGVKVRDGRFPMIAVVFPDQAAMYAEFKKLDLDVSRVAGLYATHSNRVMTHDGGWVSQIASTVRHEAAHQSAFNTGVHSRVNDTPKWITEGLGEMFEPPAMTDPRGATQLSDRVNRSSLQFIKTTYPDRHDQKFTQDVMELIAQDEPFADNQKVTRAYAVSWGMMFYLAERQPKAFAKILNHTSSRPPFTTYKRTERIADFERIVGVDTFEFSKRVAWFLQSL